MAKLQIVDESAVQGSAQWLETRKKFRNASETADVMGCGFNTPNKLKRIKAGVDEVFVNSAMKNGTRLEPQIRAWAEEKFDTMLSPAVWENGKYRASLDAISFDRTILVEVKASHFTYEAIKRGDIPEKYMYQVQHQLHCSPAEVGYLVAYSPELDLYIASEAIPFDQKLWVKVNKAWNAFDKMDVPEVEYQLIEDEVFFDLEEKRQGIYTHKQKLDEQLIEVDAEIKLYADGQNIEGKLLRVNYKTRKGNVDYKKLLKDKNVKYKEDEYRKPSTTVSSIVVLKKDADK